MPAVLVLEVFQLMIYPVLETLGSLFSENMASCDLCVVLHIAVVPKPGPFTGRQIKGLVVPHREAKTGWADTYACIAEKAVLGFSLPHLVIEIRPKEVEVHYLFLVVDLAGALTDYIGEQLICDKLPGFTASDANNKFVTHINEQEVIIGGIAGIDRSAKTILEGIGAAKNNQHGVLPSLPVERIWKLIKKDAVMIQDCIGIAWAGNKNPINNLDVELSLVLLEGQDILNRGKKPLFRRIIALPGKVNLCKTLDSFKPDDVFSVYRSNDLKALNQILEELSDISLIDKSIHPKIRNSREYKNFVQIIDDFRCFVVTM
jgi:hypothetical protein